MSDTRLILCVSLGLLTLITMVLDSLENPVREVLQGPGGFWRRLRRKRWTALLVSLGLAVATALLLRFQVFGTTLLMAYFGQLAICLVAAAPGCGSRRYSGKRGGRETCWRHRLRVESTPMRFSASFSAPRWKRGWGRC